jgi:hypothetical protein
MTILLMILIQTLLRISSKMVDTHNPLVQKFRMAHDRLLPPNAPNISIKLIGTQETHGDRYTLPVASEL